MTVKATANGKSDTRAVTVTVTDANDPPYFLPKYSITEQITQEGYGSAGIRMEGNGGYTATYPEGDTIDWSVEGIDAASFTLTGGMLRFKSAPDFEMKRSYSVTVIASDGRRYWKWLE